QSHGRSISDRRTNCRHFGNSYARGDSLVSIFGVIGNISSVIILVKHGLSRCSNILLVSLAVNDISFLVGFSRAQVPL
ncbi:hypothetical protein Btru_067441, partial [Bulinus truncatus]